MRIATTSQLYFDLSYPSSTKVVRDYRVRYEKMGALLDANAQIVELAHEDFRQQLSVSGGGRPSPYTSEQLFRSVLVMYMEGCSYRETVIRIDTSEFLRGFVGLGILPMLDYSFLCRAHSALSPSTWQSLNWLLALYALETGKISGEQMRLDSTVYEMNIHYPTDSSLLWDSFRTVARLVKRVQRARPELGLRHRFHTKKVKKLALRIARPASGKSRSKKRLVRQTYRTLIERVRWRVSVAREVLKRAAGAGYEVPELQEVVGMVEKVLTQSEQRVFEGKGVPADEKIYSVFEPHTELIIRGKSNKPVEFGHKVLIAQTGEKFIHHYSVLEHRREDVELLAPALEAHQELFAKTPELLAADKGFYQSREQLAELEQEIATVSIGKKGQRNEQERRREGTVLYQLGQRFRAGVEGSISVLKRVFSLGKCYFKGYKHYAASVGCAIFCHNLVLLTRL